MYQESFLKIKKKKKLFCPLNFWEKISFSTIIIENGKVQEKELNEILMEAKKKIIEVILSTRNVWGLVIYVYNTF